MKHTENDLVSYLLPVHNTTAHPLDPTPERVDLWVKRCTPPLLRTQVAFDRL